MSARGADVSIHDGDAEPIAGMVSFIVPVHDAEPYLRACVESILAQTSPRLEVVLVDDGSTDGSGPICDALARGDTRVRVVHTSNGGPSAARNRGLERCTGEWIFFVDADDLVAPDAVSTLLARVHPETDVVVGGFDALAGGARSVGHKGVFDAERALRRPELVDYARRYLRRPNKHTLFAYSWGRVFRASIVRERRLRFDRALHTFEDVAFNFEYLKYAREVRFVPRSVYTHRIHDGYLSATMSIAGADPGRMFGHFQALSNIGAFLRACGAAGDVEAEVAHASVSLTIVQLVRVCGQLDRRNGRQVHALVSGVVGDPEFRRNLRHYAPAPGDSRAAPRLMRWRLAWLLIALCKYKAHKRYAATTGRAPAAVADRPPSTSGVAREPELPRTER